MIPHRAKTFRLTPDRPHDRMHIRRKLPYLEDEPFQILCSSGTEDLDESTRRARHTSHEERQARADDPDVGEPAADAREESPATKQTRTLRRHRQPFGRRIDEHDAGDAHWMSRGVGSNDKGSERVADEHERSAATNACEN